MKQLLICVAVLGLLWTSSAMADPITLVNPGFEDPDYYRKINGFDGEVEDPQIPGTNMPDVPGWEDDCTRDWPRSGLNGTVNGFVTYDGDWRAFLYHGNGEGYVENIVWQLTDRTIVAGDRYAMTAQCMSGGTYNTDVRLELSFFYDDGLGNHTEIASNYTDVPDDDLWYECTSGTVIDVDAPEAIGKKLGVKFTSVDIGNDNVGWLGFDAVTLDTVAGPLVIQVNTITGDTSLVNSSGADYDIDFYSIASESGALDVNGWVGIEDQVIPGFPAGDGTGNGWEKGGGSNSMLLGEAYLQSSSMAVDGTVIPLGTAFTLGSAEDLVFEYHLASGEFVEGEIEYVTFLSGDFDEDGAVDDDDCMAWQSGFGTTSGATHGVGDADADMDVDGNDFLIWQRQYGSGGSSAHQAAVPEPSSLVLIAVLAFLLGTGSRTTFLFRPFK